MTTQILNPLVVGWVAEFEDIHWWGEQEGEYNSNVTNPTSFSTNPLYVGHSYSSASGGYDEYFKYYKTVCRFNLTSIPSGATISNAKLKFNVTSANTFNINLANSLITTSTNYYIDASTLLGTSSGTGNKEINITSTIQGWFNSTIPNNGIVFSGGTNLGQITLSSLTLEVTYIFPPTKPLNFQGNIDTVNNKINYSWTDSTGETKYQIRNMIGLTPNLTTDPIVQVNGLNDIPENTTTAQINYTPTEYQIKRYIVAINDDGMSEPSDVSILTPPPLAPSLFNTTNTTSKTVDCSWADNSSNESVFKIYNRLGATPNPLTDTWLKTVSENTTSTTITGLTEGVTYNLYIVASNETGNSSASNVRTVTPSANLTKNLSINYDILSTIQKSIDFNYDIRNQVSNQIEIVYNLNKQPVERSISFNYDIYGIERFKLGKYKLGQKSLGFTIATEFFDLTETITLVYEPRATVFNLTEGIVVARSSTRNLTEYFTYIYASTHHNLTETINISASSVYNISESILIKAETYNHLNETLSVVFTGSQDLSEDISVYYDGKLDTNENLTVYGESSINLSESINISIDNIFNLNETINIGRLGLRNLDETLTIIAERNINLTETIKVVYDGRLDLTETITISTNSFSIVETITVKSLGIDGIILYEDAQHTKLVDNNVHSFLYDFGTIKEEEKIFTFYILNTKPINITNLWVRVDIDGLKNKYNANMVFVSNNGVDWVEKQTLVAASIPTLQSKMFAIKISPLLGIDTEQDIKINFSLYTR